MKEWKNEKAHVGPATGDCTLRARAPSSGDQARSRFVLCEGNGGGAVGCMAPPTEAGNGRHAERGL